MAITAAVRQEAESPVLTGHLGTERTTFGNPLAILSVLQAEIQAAPAPVSVPLTCIQNVSPESIGLARGYAAVSLNRQSI